MNNKPLSFTGKTVYQGNGRSITHDPRGAISHITGASNSGLAGPSPGSMKRLNTSLNNLNQQLQNSNRQILDQMAQRQKQQAEQQAKRNEENNRRMAQVKAEQQKKFAEMHEKNKAAMEATQALIIAAEAERKAREEENRRQEEAQRQANEEARQREMEAARALEEQQRLAQEAARISEEQEAQRKVEEAKRISASLIALRNGEDKQTDSLAQEFSLLSTTQPAEKLQETAAAETYKDNAVTLRHASPSHNLQAMAVTAVSLPLSAPLAGNIAVSLENAIAALSRVATLTPAGAMVTTVFVGLLPTKAGEGSGDVGKYFVKSLPAAMLDMPPEESLRIAAEKQHAIDVPLRGRLGLSKGEIHIELIRTEQPSRVRVVTGIPDNNGNFLCTVPGTDSLPARTILVSPNHAPGAGGLGAVITPDHSPKAIAHTGGQTQPANLPTLTAYPGLDEKDFNDLIVVPPLESGDKPIYVMLSGKKDRYEPNKGSVGNIGEFFRQPGFGNQLSEASQKTGLQYQGQNIFKATDDIGETIKRGDQFYLDGQHKNHIELFDKRGNFKAVLNLDNSVNREKTQSALGRKIK